MGAGKNGLEPKPASRVFLHLTASVSPPSRLSHPSLRCSSLVLCSLPLCPPPAIFYFPPVTTLSPGGLWRESGYVITAAVLSGLGVGMGCWGGGGFVFVGIVYVGLGCLLIGGFFSKFIPLFCLTVTLFVFALSYLFVCLNGV